jgi:hypothetical protein
VERTIDLESELRSIIKAEVIVVALICLCHILLSLLIGESIPYTLGGIS